MEVSIKLNPNPLEKALHERALVIATNYRRIESDLIDILQKLDEKKVFQSLGYSSLFQYAVEELKLSEQVAYSFIRVARKAREIPEIKEEIKAGNLTVSKVHRITPVLQKENAKEWIEKAKTLPKRQLEKAIAKIQPRVLTPEKSSYVTEKRLQVQLGVEEEVFEQLKRVQDLLSQKSGKPASFEDALAEMSRFYLEKNDPVKKAERLTKKKDTLHGKPSPIIAEKEKKPELCPGIVGEKKRFVAPRKPIPAVIRHKVNRRDQGRCAYLNSNNKRCEETRWLDLHHRIPIAQGGSDSPNNLITLCKTHHRLMHQDEVWRYNHKNLKNQMGLRF